MRRDSMINHVHWTARGSFSLALGAAMAAAALPAGAQSDAGRGKSLPAIIDYAATGMRPASGFRFFVTNAGPMDVQQGVFGIGPARATRGTSLLTQFTEITLFATAAPGDWQRNRAIVTSLDQVTGGGAALSYNYHFANPGTSHWLPADASLGFSHSGARSTAASDATCLNHTASGLPAGVTLMAGSDCERTWGINGWEGRRPVPLASYLTLFTANPSAFRFNFFEVPPQLTDTTAFLGDKFSTYGIANDYARERRQAFGAVIPGGVGTPASEGYPMGLEWKFDAFYFNALPGVVFWQATVTNRTRQLYGTPLDYDSLYTGILARHPGVRRRAGFDVSRGAAVFNDNGHNATCDNARPVPGVFSFGGYTGNCPSVSGFNVGTSSVVFLKSPIGDLRYKLFSQPTSPFYFAASPVAGDTITFNIGRLCGDDCIQERFTRAGSGFGVIAAREALALGGDAPAAIEPFQYWQLFHPQNGAPYGFGPRVDLSNPRAGGGFNFMVPGGWSYQTRPSGAPAGDDTLFIDTCNPISNTCVGRWLDTLPDRSINFTRNATWVGAGPFRLDADSSAAMILAIVAAGDSASVERSINSAIELYQAFFIAPGPPPPPRIVSTSIRGGSFRVTNLTVTLDNRASTWDDPYLRLLAERFRDAAPTTLEGRLQAVNRLGPLGRTIADTLDILATNNVSQLLVFKSCDGGRNYTTSNSPNICTRDVVRDTLGRDIGPAAYRTLARDVNQFSDGNVMSGQSYYYAFVPVSRGVRLQLRDSTATGQRVFDTTLVAATMSVPSTASAPNVLIAYIPASQQAGSDPARVELTREGYGPSTSDVIPGTTFDTTWNGVTVRLLDTLPAGRRLQVVFGDTVLVVEYSTTGVVDSTIVIARRGVTTGHTMLPATGRTVANAYANPIRARLDTLRYSSATQATLPVLVMTGTSTTATATVGTQTVRTTTITGATATPGFATTIAGSPVVRPTGVAVILDGTPAKPLLVTNILTVQTTLSSTYLRSPDYPDYTVDITNRPVVINSTAAVAGGAQLVEKYYVLPTLGRIIQAANSIRPTLDWQQNPSRLIGTSFGEHVFTFAGPEFGPGAPFIYQTFLQLQNDFNASLAGRTNFGNTEVSAEIVAAINGALGTSYTADSLVSVAIPFRAVNRSNGGSPVIIAMRRSDKYAMVRVGSGADTVQLNVPAGVWIPGEPLILLERVRVGINQAGQAQRNPDGTPVTADTLVVTASRAIIGCSATAPYTCNPLIGRGGTGHISFDPNEDLVVRYAVPHQAPREYEFQITPTVAGERIANVSRGQLDSVKVVPNPYVLYSSFEQEPTNEQRLMFTHLPPAGTIRIFTAAGRFVQELKWTPEDLHGNGDLFWNLQTREGTLVASGLYLFTVRATGPNRIRRETVGRFVVIR